MMQKNIYQKAYLPLVKIDYSKLIYMSKYYLGTRKVRSKAKRRFTSTPHPSQTLTPLLVNLSKHVFVILRLDVLTQEFYSYQTLNSTSITTIS